MTRRLLLDQCFTNSRLTLDQRFAEIRPKGKAQCSFFSYFVSPISLYFIFPIFLDEVDWANSRPIMWCPCCTVQRIPYSLSNNRPTPDVRENSAQSRRCHLHQDEGSHEARCPWRMTGSMSTWSLAMLGPQVTAGVKERPASMRTWNLVLTWGMEPVV